MWSAARFTLRLSDAEFFELTPRQLHLLIARRNDQVEHDEYMLATIAAVLCNVNGAERSTDDFMPSRWKAREAEQAQIDHGQRLARKIEALLGIHNQQCQNKSPDLPKPSRH